ncbi:hypothetical protein TcG_09893 [Trypanosoma cruzi]|nr:hypothetical protein TcG_09893 [Trypanosoma cruzi]
MEWVFECPFQEACLGPALRDAITRRSNMGVRYSREADGYGTPWQRALLDAGIYECQHPITFPRKIQHHLMLGESTLGRKNYNNYSCAISVEGCWRQSYIGGEKPPRGAPIQYVLALHAQYVAVWYCGAATPVHQLPCRALNSPAMASTPLFLLSSCVSKWIQQPARQPAFFFSLGKTVAIRRSPEGCP